MQNKRDHGRTPAHTSRTIAAFVAALAFACAPDALGPRGRSVETVLVAPSDASVSVGATLTLNAEVRDGGGSLLATQRVSWASEDTSIAEVSASGIVTGKKVGSVLISASSWGKDAFARVTVNPTPVASIRLSSTHRAMFLGDVAQLTAEPLDASGRVLANRPVEWKTSDPDIATVTSGGLVSAISVGGAIVTATSEGISAVASITVSSVPVAAVVVSPSSSDLVSGQTAQLSAELRDAAGNVLVGRAVVWNTTNAQIATVTSGGLVTAVSTGQVTISASSDGRTGSATIRVSPRPASAVIVSPAQVTLFPGQTLQLSALVTDDRGQVLPGRPIAFSSGSPLAATVSASGLVTGVAPGLATITATSDGANGTAAVTIAPEPVAAVEVSPNPASIMVGQATQLTAVAKNANGQALTGRTVTWSSGTPSLASVSTLGTVTGVSAGNAVIVATIDGKQGSGVVNVRQVPVATVTVSPSTATLAPGQTTPLGFTLRDAAGNQLFGRVVGWTSSDNTIATVSSFGVVTAVAAGSVTIVATSEGQSGTAAVTVGAVTAASVTVTPNQATLIVGQGVTLVATALDSLGNVLTGRTVSWASNAQGVASVSGTGDVAAIAPGAATITATIDGKTGSAAITVNPVPPAPPVLTSISLSPSSFSVALGATQSLSATARDQYGNAMPGVAITWSSGNAAVASVTSSGVVTGVAVGSTSITASSGTVSGSSSATVTPPPVHHIVVTPSNTTLNAGKTVQLTATLYDSQNNVLTGRTVTWTSADASKVSVSSNGLATAKKKGTVIITASSGGVSGTATVKVN